MASLALCSLGNFQARLPSGSPVTISAKWAQALLACLAVSSGNRLSREKLADLLWSDRDEAHASNSLRQALTALRRDLAPCEPFPLMTSRDRPVLDDAVVEVDVWRFERLAASKLSTEIAEAAALYPNDAKSAANRGWFEVCTGHPAAGLAFLDRADRLDPNPPNWFWNFRGMALYELGRYAEAAAVFERMTATPAWVPRYRAACYAQLGRCAEARAIRDEALAREPRFTLRQYAMNEPYISRADLDHLIDGMRKAGPPE